LHLQSKIRLIGRFLSEVTNYRQLTVPALVSRNHQADSAEEQDKSQSTAGKTRAVVTVRLGFCKKAWHRLWVPLPFSLKIYPA